MLRVYKSPLVVHAEWTNVHSHCIVKERTAYERQEETMAQENWKEERKNILRLSNEESHKITCESIEIALLHLMQEKGYPDITISEIVKKAGVSRSAYYKNYTDKESVLQSLLERAFNSSIEHLKRIMADEDTSFWTQLFESLLPYRDVYRVIARAGLRGLLYDTCNEFAMNFMDRLEDRNRYYMLFYAGGITNVIVEWVSAKEIEPPENMGKLIGKMIPE